MITEMITMKLLSSYTYTKDSFNFMGYYTINQSHKSNAILSRVCGFYFLSKEVRVERKGLSTQLYLHSVAVMVSLVQQGLKMDATRALLVFPNPPKRRNVTGIPVCSCISPYPHLGCWNSNCAKNCWS